MSQCDCHDDYHELGVHRPGYQPTDQPDDPLASEPGSGSERPQVERLPVVAVH